MGSDGTDGARGSADRLSIRALEGGRGLRIDDRIERRHCEVATGDPVEPVPAARGGFRYPVDEAVSVTTDRLTFEGFSRTFVHDGESVAEVDHFESASFGPGSYELELSGPVKLYVDVEGPLRVETTVVESRLVLGERRSVRIGARSYHERPAATVTTTADPDDVVRAVSTFGSALKTTRSERSYPTLRGHPPALELGEELSIPRGLEPPESAVRLEVPRSLRDALVVSPLAYYLGARVVPGDAPRLVVDGEPFALDAEGGLERTVERTLKRTFLLDCLVRSAGPRATPLHERLALEPSLELDLEDLYGRPGAERLRAYMEVPHATVAEHLPAWKLTAHVDPVGSSLEVLPFLVDDLAVVRAASAAAGSRPGTDSWFATRGATGTADDEGRFVDVEPTGSLEQAWVGPGTPLGASKAVPEAYRNRLERRPRDDEISIVVVCNDEGMLAERDGVESVYGTREEFPVDVTFYEGLSRDRLALVLESDVDFLHYIGHVDADGFECADGTFDATVLETVGVDIFFLNACRSYRQGRRLIERGAVAGVVTLDDVIDSGAVRIGRTLAELLDYGFPLRSALNLSRSRSIVGSQYLVVGDGNADIAQAPNGAALLADVTTVSDGYELDLTTYPATGAGMGSQFRPAISGVDRVYLAPGPLPTFRLSAADLEAYLSTSVFPVRLDGEFTWSDRAALDG